MKMIRRCVSCILLILFQLFSIYACAGAVAHGSVKPESEGNPADSMSESETDSQRAPQTAMDALPDADTYIQTLASEKAAALITPDMDAREKIRSAYKWVIENVYFADPIGVDSWQLAARPDKAPAFLENRAFSPLQYGVGSCEDFAAALTLLLRGMGFRAQYVSGLVISAEGDFVDHAWTVVCMDGIWYHLDSQLEQNVTKDGTLRYLYFLKGDGYMLSDHRWGENLADYWGAALDSNDRDFLLASLTPPACPSDVPAQSQEKVSLPLKPSNALLRSIETQRKDFERLHGPLPQVVLQMEPPIFLIMPES